MYRYIKYLRWLSIIEIDRILFYKGFKFLGTGGLRETRIVIALHALLPCLSPY